MCIAQRSSGHNQKPRTDRSWALPLPPASVSLSVTVVNRASASQVCGWNKVELPHVDPPERVRSTSVLGQQAVTVTTAARSPWVIRTGPSMLLTRGHRETEMRQQVSCQRGYQACPPFCLEGGKGYSKLEAPFLT